MFAFTSSPLGLRGQSAWASARHSRPSWSGLPSGTESFLRGAVVTHLLWCPPWWWAGFTWSRPKRTLIAEHPLPPMSGQGLGAGIGFHFFVTFITHGTYGYPHFTDEGGAETREVSEVTQIQTHSQACPCFHHNMRTPQCPRSPGSCPSSANLICGIGQVTSPLWASISSTARYDCDGGGKVVTLEWAFFVFLPPSDSLGHVCARRSGGCWSGEGQCCKGECAGGRLSCSLLARPLLQWRL